MNKNVKHIMRPINFIYHGFDPVINEHWTEEYPAFLIDDYTVIRFEDDSVQIYRFRQSLTKKDAVDYFSVDGRIKRAAIHFEGFDDMPSDLTKSLAEIITKI
jgi:hypothetical protein